MGHAETPTKKKSDLRSSVRFQVDDVAPLVYRKGLLQNLGIGRVNEARAAINLSEGGILIRTEGRIPRDTKVKVRLELEKFKDTFEAEGVVCWCGEGAEGGEFYAGIQFIDLPAKVKAKIARLRGYFTSPEYRTRTAARRKRESFGFSF